MRGLLLPLLLVLGLLAPLSAVANFEIVVDRAKFQLHLYKNGEMIHSQKVIVGKAGKETPRMETVIRNIELNPVWDIPVGLEASYISKVKRNPSGMRAKGYRLYQDGREVSVSAADWSRGVDVKQSAGRSNVLGELMFDLEGSTRSQMHDTPAKHLFRKSVRKFSSGCIRLENAHTLASIILGKPVSEVRKMIRSSGNETLIPVYPYVKVKVK